MEYDESARAVNFLAGFFLGAVVGAGVALLVAPQSGRRTRRRLRRAAVEVRSGAQDRWEEVAREVRERVDEALKAAREKLPA